MNAIESIKAWLANEGYKATPDDEGGVIFKYQGFTMWAMHDERDPLFLRIVMPNIYEVGENRLQVFEALNIVNDNIKSVKGFISGNNQVWLAIEMYLDTSPEVEDFMERCLEILLVAGHKFVDNLGE